MYDRDQATDQWMEPSPAGASEDLRHCENTFGSRDPSGLLDPSKRGFLKSRPKRTPWLDRASLGRKRGVKAKSIRIRSRSTKGN